MTNADVPVMDAGTLEALRGSIAKWEGIVAGTEIDKGPDNCPLCLKFNGMVNPAAQSGCRGCPVRERTGEWGCQGSPYEDYENLAAEIDKFGDPVEPDPEKLAALAREELDFLKSLLPSEVIPALDQSHG